MGEEVENHDFCKIEQMYLGRGKNQEEMCGSITIVCGLPSVAGSLADPEGWGPRCCPKQERGGSAT